MPKENLDHLTQEAMRFFVDLHLEFKKHPKEINEIVNQTMVGIHVCPLSHYLLEHPDIIAEAQKLEQAQQKPKRFSLTNLFKKNK